MFRGESVQPLSQSPRVMPPGTLPIDGEPPMSREDASSLLHNPLQAHAQGAGRGQVAVRDQLRRMPWQRARAATVTVRFLLRVPPADLTAGVAAQRSDGYIYATIRNGSIVMPSYADAMSSMSAGKWCSICARCSARWPRK